MRKLLSFICLLISVWLGAETATAQQSKQQFVGTPLVQNYAKGMYMAGNQNWSASCSSDGSLYFGNNDGLLAFDGQHWQTYSLPNKLIVRSVSVSTDGLIYTGALGQFGYWKKNAYGQLRYHSLSDALSERDKPKDEIWKIYAGKERVLFQSFSAIYTYEKGRWHILRSADPFLFLYEVNGRYFVEIIAKGLYELVDHKLKKVIDKSAYGDSRILSILPHGQKSYLIGTAKKGVFHWNGKSVTPWLEASVQADLEKFQLNNGVQIHGIYAFGTILNGIYLINQQGKLVQHIRVTNGLQNNTVLSLQEDRQGNLWAGLDNGIDRIEINSPLYYYNDKSGSFGTVYTAALYQGKLYVGTNQGLYVSRWIENSASPAFDFRLIEGSQGQVWDLSVYNGELICGHNDGTFKLENDQVIWLSKVTGGYFLQTVPWATDYLIQGTYTGLALFKQEGEKWLFDRKIDHFEEPVQFLQQAGNRKLWASGYRGLYLLEFNAAGEAVTDYKQYTVKQGLPQSSYINVFDLAGRTVFATDSGFYLYDDIADRFHAYTQLNERLGSFFNANKIVPTTKGRYWFIRKGHLALVQFNDGGHVTIDSVQFAGLRNRMLHYYENVNTLTPDLSLVSLDDGFALYNDQNSSNLTDLPKPLIQEMDDITDSIASKLPFFRNRPLELDYKQRNIRIRYALPFYAVDGVDFQYLLEGSTNSWSAWEKVAQKEFTNLPSGDYMFKVRAKTIDGRVSPIASLTFSVRAPWYRSVWAWLIYSLLFLLLFFIVKAMYKKKLRKHQEEVRRKMLIQQEERLQQEALLNEQRLVKLRNNQLEKELASKSRELANSAMNIVYKNELLNNIHDELLQLKDHEGKKLSTDQLKKISKIIEDARSDDRDWNLFEKSFNEAHENFFKKLKSHYPDLVPNDLKLCAYLRMNMSSKEIASLLNITTRGVEIRRYRLRKKLNLGHDDNLSAFLMEI